MGEIRDTGGGSGGVRSPRSSAIAQIEASLGEGTLNVNL